MSVYVFDCDGVLYLDETPIPGAADALAAAEDEGHKLLFCTNNSARTPDHLVDKLSRLLAYEAAPRQVITSAEAAAAQLLARGIERAFILGMPGIAHALDSVGIEIVPDQMASAVVVGLDLEVDYAKIRDAANAVRRGALFVATNTDATYPVPDGEWPGAGTLVNAVATAGGRAPDLVAGKPHPPMVELVRARAGDDDIVMVGDRPETDIALARAGGWRSVLVLTGVTRDPAMVPVEYRADVTLAGVGDLFTSD